MEKKLSNISAPNYTIYFNEEAYTFLEEHLNNHNYSKLFILTDSNTHEYCLPWFLSQLVTDIPFEILEMEVGEVHKNIHTCDSIWQALAELEADRSSLFINLGGGVVTDLGGFVASTFKRGIDFLHVPTSLLAMVDAAIGGKNGVDLGAIKNQIGVIQPPFAVLIDTTFLESLPQSEMRSGLAEMLKHGLIYDCNYWEQFQRLDELTGEDLDLLVHRSVVIKNEIVQQDPFEKGIRKALNFGHTLGHAIESYFMESDTHNAILHGEAVAAGMILESHIALQKGLLKEDDYVTIKSTLTTLFDKLHIGIEQIENLHYWMKFDKKNSHGKVKFVLLQGIGKVVVDQEVDDDMIINALTDYNI
ncbi:MAG: 3-dehydroquinate synthase [Flavobacterium sp.]